MAGEDADRCPRCGAEVVMMRTSGGKLLSWEPRRIAFIDPGTGTVSTGLASHFFM